MKEGPQPATVDHRSAGAGSHKPCPGAPGTNPPEDWPCVARYNRPREVWLGAREVGCQEKKKAVPDARTLARLHRNEAGKVSARIFGHTRIGGMG